MREHLDGRKGAGQQEPQKRHQWNPRNQKGKRERERDRVQNYSENASANLPEKEIIA